MDTSSLQRALRIQHVRHQERLRCLSLSSGAHQRCEQVVAASAQVLWKHALTCAAVVRGRANDAGVASSKAGIQEAHTVLAHAYADLQQGVKAASSQHLLLARARSAAAESDQATTHLGTLVRNRLRQDAMQLEAQQSEELIELALSSRAPHSKSLAGISADALQIAAPVASNEPRGLRSVEGCCVAIAGYEASGPLGDRGEVRGVAAAPIAGDGGGVALRVKGALECGKELSIEVRQGEGNRIDATIMLPDYLLLSRVVSERRQLLATLDAAQLPVATLEIIAQERAGDNAGTPRRGLRRGRVVEVAEGDDEIVLS